MIYTLYTQDISQNPPKNKENGKGNQGVLAIYNLLRPVKPMAVVVPFRHYCKYTERNGYNEKIIVLQCLHYVSMHQAMERTLNSTCRTLIPGKQMERTFREGEFSI